MGINFTLFVLCAYVCASVHMMFVHAGVHMCVHAGVHMCVYVCV